MNDNMARQGLSSVIVVSFILGLAVVLVAGIVGISTPFIGFSYFVLVIGLLLVAVAEIGLLLLIVISAVGIVKQITGRNNYYTIYKYIIL